MQKTARETVKRMTEKIMSLSEHMSLHGKQKRKRRLSLNKFYGNLNSLPEGWRDYVRI